MQALHHLDAPTITYLVLAAVIGSSVSAFVASILSFFSGKRDS